MIIRFLLILTILNIFIFTSVSHAYLDPGTGSIIIQSIIAFFAAVGGIISLYWSKLTSIFKKKTKDKDKIDQNK